MSVEIHQSNDMDFKLFWRVSNSVLKTNFPNVRMDNCEPQIAPLITTGEQITTALQHYSCQSIEGLPLSFNYPVANPSLATLVRIHWANGEHRSFLLPPDERQFVLPAPEQASEVASSYFTLGFNHILSGYDHLLFLVCIILIAGRFSRVVICISGFTLAHSVTLALVVLNAFQLPEKVVEVLIALSILFLARELLSGSKGSLTWRYPIAISTLFGLLHGLGFSAGLKAIGLPQTEIPTALIFFNIGVEAGQIGFLSLFAFSVTQISRVKNQLWPNIASNALQHLLRLLAAPLSGCFAGYWFFERLLS